MLFWILFHCFLLVFLTIDLRKEHKSIRSAAMFSIFWVSLALIFMLGIGFYKGSSEALVFGAAYFLEASLSIDNLFLFTMVFSFCKIPIAHQRKVLILGILGALVFRLILILLGISLLEHFKWTYILFGAVLCGSAVLFFLHKEQEESITNSAISRFLIKYLRVDSEEKSGKFFLLKKGKLYATKLFLALSLIEIFDLIFAIDSIPAVLAVTTDPFLAYTSNAFAILGLRSFYTLVSHLKDKFKHFKSAVSVILLFIGCKLILEPFYEIETLITIGFIFGSIGIAIFLSFVQKNTNNA